MVQHDLPSVGRVHTGPVRTCIGCRQRVLAAELLRVVARAHGSDGTQPNGFEVVPDPGRRLPGRGAWVHPTTDCLNLAARRRAFGRALKVSGVPDTTALDQLVGSSAENSRAARGEGDVADTNSDIEL